MKADLFKKMNLFLANQTVLYMKFHNLHWFVTGRNFFTLHQKFEDLYNSAGEIADEVAERLLALEQSPLASYDEILKIATIKERKSGLVESADAVKIVLDDLNLLIKDAIEIRKLAGDAGDAGTEDMFVQYVKDYEKLRWMLKAMMQSV